MRRIWLPLWALVAVWSSQARAQDEAEASPETLRSEAFIAAQYSLISDAAAALQRVTARFASGSGAIAGLERDRDAKVAALAAIDRDIARQVSSRALSSEATAALAARRSAARDQLAAVDKRFASEFPQYSELTRPRALDIRETQKLLNPDEALLLLLVADEATYIWAVTRERSTWARSEKMRGAELAKKVDALRASMQVDGARGQVQQPVSSATRAPGSFGEPASLGFQTDLAFELYRELIAPVETVLAGKQVVLTNVTGALTALPLALLVTKPVPMAPGAEVDLTAVSWLGDQYALAELPSVSSLRAIRCLLIANRAQAHSGCGTSAASLNHGRRERSGGILLAGYGAPTLGGSLGDGRSAPPTLGAVFDGTLADTGKLRALAYLPQARAELESLGRRFGRNATIIVGDRATEAAVKASPDVASARFVVFSTHGLLATEIGENAEPGLVFTPPAEASKSALDDGFLSASEAAQLKLAADLVVLSACNTAASSGRPGAEGLSGLARSFFYAGARSLLVSHWAVNDEATSLLMQRTFENIQTSNFVSRARALQQAMRTLRSESNGHFANPKYWAAFTLVGEAGK